MLKDVSRQYLFILPHPSASPSKDEASLCGISYVVTDADFNIIGKKEFKGCRTIEYILPSPAYLFSQGIDPYNLLRYPTEHSFFEECRAMLSNPGVSIFTWNVKNLGILKKIASRCLQRTDVLANIPSLCDVNVLLKTHEMFTKGVCTQSDNLVECAKANGFKAQISVFDQNLKLDALIYLVKTISEENQNLITFMLREQSLLRSSLQKTIDADKILLSMNVKERSLELLKPFKLTPYYLDALYYDGNSVKRRYYYQSDFDLLSPVGVLTDERLAITAFDLNEAMDALNAFKGDIESENSLPFELTHTKDFSEADQKEYEKLLSVKTIIIDGAPLSCSDKFRQLVFLCRGNNFKGGMINSELEAYYQYCIKSLNRQMPVYELEVKSLFNRLDENDERALTLIKNIEQFPRDL